MGLTNSTLLEVATAVKVPRSGGAFGGRHIPAPFAQAAVAAIERLGLYTYRWLSPKTGQLLEDALYAIRRELGLPPPHHPMLSWRDWPGDARAGDALGSLLGRLDEMEHAQHLLSQPSEARLGRAR